jgi:hypothetical protein
MRSDHDHCETVIPLEFAPSLTYFDKILFDFCENSASRREHQTGPGRIAFIKENAMFCPQCGSTQSDELKFCKACGANLLAVRKAVASPESVEGFDWNKTWLAEMMMSGRESVRHAAEIERLQGITPETKRRREIKAGIIVGSVGLALMITLFMIMQGIILGGFVSQAVAELLSRIWIAGIIPVFVGLALIVNGMYVSKRGEPKDEHQTEDGTSELAGSEKAEFLPPAETHRLGASIPFSVTDETTQHLKEAIPRTESKKAS